MTNSVKITCQQYLILQAMFNCAADDYREVLQKVYYDFDLDEFQATDGHVLRIEKLVWEIDTEDPQKVLKPEFSFTLSKNDLILTKTQLKAKFGKSFESVFIELEYKPLEFGENYPNIRKVLPENYLDGSFFPLEHIGISFSTYSKFYSGFYVKPFGDTFFFKFTGNSKKAILVFTKNPDNGMEKIFRGIIMPMSIPEGFFEESIWEITLKEKKEI